ncbi:unnamed protein product, partial [Amaranthus hypochondriacus]
MAGNKFSTMLHRRTNRITRVLIYAILEWVLIFFLLLNSLFSYFILKFALYFGLKPPCLLCSRLDCFLDYEKKDRARSFSSYSEIICEQHAAEISRIGYCSNHRKLVESQYVCDDCSSSSHDHQVLKWMTEIGFVKDGVEESDLIGRCSCCDRVINPIKKVSSLDIVIKEKELLGCDFSDQKKQENFDESDDSKFGYQVLDDGDEEDVILEAEKEPLLQNNNDSNEKTKEHLEFYIDHDDYRLIPVEFIADNLIKVCGEEENKEFSEKSREFELVFDGFELVLPRSELSPSKDLPSIKEEEEVEESVIENVQISKDEGKMEESDKIELVFEGHKLVSGSENLSIDEEKREMESLGNHKDEEEQEKEIANVVCTPILDVQECVDQAMEADRQATTETHSPLSVYEDNALHLENEETITEEKHQIPTDELFIQEYKENYEARIETETESNQNLTGNLLIQEHEEISSHLGSYESKTEAEAETETESKQNQPADESSTLCQPESHTISDNVVALEVSTSLPHDDETSELGSHESKTEPEAETETETDNEKKHNQTADELSTPCQPESHTISENVVLEVSTSCPHDAETGERSLNANVDMHHNEVEEERIPDTPTSSESLNHLQRKLSLLGRRESGTEESLDGMSMISEQESLETTEKLKADLLSERKALRTLYKELEEERNASAIAANQTMAMITRLQEEKATMQMEALQYQRMMEEQSEYDQEALQMMNELVVKREKEKQELEKELEVYKKKVMDY